MNKTVIKIFCLLILSSVIVGCAKESNLDSGVEHYITGTVPSSNNTKTTIEKNGEFYNVKWASGDKLYVVGKSDYSVPYYYQLQESSIGSKTGQFKSTGAYCMDDSGILACYPMEWCSAYNQDYVSVAIPQNQDISLKGIAPMIGKGTLADGVNFRHISSVLRLRLYTDVDDTFISTIKVSNDYPIAGEIYAPSVNYDTEDEYIYDVNIKKASGQTHIA